MQLNDFPLIKIAVFFTAGILIADLLPVQQKLIFIIISVIVILCVIAIKFLHIKPIKFLFIILIYISVLLCGSLIYKSNAPSKYSVLDKFMKEKKSFLYGKVENIELKKDYEVLFTLKIDSIFFNKSKILCNDYVLCKFRADSIQRYFIYENLRPGNSIYLTGTFQQGRNQRNPGEFDYNQYLKSKGISGLFISYDSDTMIITNKAYSHFNSVIFSIRKSIDEKIHLLHTKQTAALLRGLLLADRSEIDYETKTQFINSGVVHILAVSGLHVGYVLLIFIFLFGRFNIYLRAMFTILGIIAFLFITGVQPSVFRATIMAVVLIIAFLSGRSTNIINSLSIAALIILIINPNEIFNPGFQLSFSAVLSIALLYPCFKNLINQLRIKRSWIKNILLFISVSLSAQIGTLPFTLAYFSKLSIISLFANLLVIPLVGVIIGLGFATILFSYFLNFAAAGFASANDLISFLMIQFIRFTGSLDFSFLWIRNYTFYNGIIFYLSLVILIYLLQKTKNRFVKIVFTFLVLINLIVFSSLDNKSFFEKNRLSVLMIDVGQGDSFLINFPNGKTALIDAGIADPYTDMGERVIAPLLDYLGIEKIDYGFISHLDLDHYGGFVSLIYNGRINTVFRPKPDSSSKSKRFEAFLEERKIQRYFYRKTSLDVGNCKIYFLNNPDEPGYNLLSSNDKSGIIKLVYGKKSFLFVGDCEYPGEQIHENNFQSMLDSDVLKVGHHGSPTGSSRKFLNLVSPEISLLSVGIKNKFNHPGKRVVQELSSINSKILRTDKMGAVLLESDGTRIEIINWKL